MPQEARIISILHFMSAESSETNTGAQEVCVAWMNEWEV